MITTVSYQKTYSVGPYMTEKIGVEASVDENQDPKFVLAELKKLCDEVNAANNPHMQTLEVDVPYIPPFTVDGLEQPTTAIKQEPTKAQTVEEQIRTCQDADTLEKTYKYLVKTNASWRQAYEETMDRLTKQAKSK